jgi:hypothetical protein
MIKNKPIRKKYKYINSVINHNKSLCEDLKLNNFLQKMFNYIYKSRIIICIIALFISSFFVRLNHIEDFTEFLGDQGSAGVVILENFHNHTIPLVGPTASTGQRPGPIYYYLIAPWLIISGFNPVAPAVAMVFYSSLTVVILFVLLRKLSNTPISFLLSILYSFSPLLFDRSRNAWPPTVVPLFVCASLYLLLHIRDHIGFISKKIVLLLGICNGIIIQLHYGSILFLLFSLVFVVGLIFKHHKRRIRDIFIYVLLFFVGIGIAELPFLIFQYIHGFEDFKKLLLLFLSPEYIKDMSTLPIDRPSFLDLSSRLFFNLVYMPEPIHRVVTQIVILGIPLIIGLQYEMFLVIYYILTIILLHFYNGPVPDHYLNFLIPFPFMFLAIILRKLPKNYYIIFYIVPILLIGLQIYRYSIQTSLVERRMDIPKTRWLTDEMMQESSGKLFSFTPILSRSFSDYHYRFFFAKAGRTVEPITNNSYNLLYLTCEKATCPTWEELKTKKFIDVLCFDHVCGSSYPKIEIDKWSLLNIKDNPYGGKLYTLLKTQ